MASELKPVQERVEELMAAKKKQGEIVKVLKEEGYKSRRGKPFSQSAIVYYSKKSGTKKGGKKGGPKPKPTGYSSVLSAIHTLTSGLPKQEKVALAVGILQQA